MFKYDCKYENFDGKEVTETLYFHFSSQELIRMGSENNGSLLERLERIVNTKNDRSALVELADIVLLAYGKRSQDGNRFYKNDEVREDFKASPAYDEVYMRLFLDPEFSEKFMSGILPKDIDKESLSKMLKERGIDAANLDHPGFMPV